MSKSAETGKRRARSRMAEGVGQRETNNHRARRIVEIFLLIWYARILNESTLGTEADP